MSLNKVIIQGNISNEIECKQTQNGTSVCSFNVAVNRYSKDPTEKKVDFFTAVAWGAKAEFVSRYFKKGQAMLVCGELQTRSWQDNSGNKRYATEVVASEASFCEAKRDGEGSNPPVAQSGSQGKKTASSFVPGAFLPNAGDEGLPF